MPETKFLEWNYPEENEDPHFEKLSAFFASIDDGLFGVMNSAGNVIIPPDTIVWNGLARSLSWTGYFEIPMMSIGFSLRVQFGPDGVNKVANFNDGDRLVITVPRSISGNVDANFQVVSGAVAIEHGLLTVGFCRNNKFYANFPQVYL